ncbi:MAG: exodeoxyribonuclease VII large subunit [Moraxella sp.]|nr:exodeoxyribonuclease VII large subunit [Moraxella sp.]
MNDFYDQLHGTTLELADYLNAVKLVLDDTFAHEVWVKAELRSVNSKSGHYYFELAQKDDNNRIIASCRATLWRYQASKVARFEKATGQPLAAGLSVLMKGSASFHPQYGFSFNVTDIDPNHTLGALAQAYQAMIKKLADNGLLALNKRLPIPFDIQNVVVIAPESAAGLGDFRAEADRLHSAGACHFYYHHATFQGNHAPVEIRSSIITGLQSFERRFGGLPDLLVVIRGGGAVGDLAYLNDYELAALLAESPVPVWVGIGHERDTVLLDEVAHTRFDTPSKVIHGIESLLANRWLAAKEHMNNVHRYAKEQLLHAKKDSERQLDNIQSAAKHQVLISRQLCDSLLMRIKNQSMTNINQARKNCEYLQSLILIQHPQRTLQQGYAIVRQNGQIITSKDVQGAVQIEFKDGVVGANIA